MTTLTQHVRKISREIDAIDKSGREISAWQRVRSPELVEPLTKLRALSAQWRRLNRDMTNRETERYKGAQNPPKAEK